MNSGADFQRVFEEMLVVKGLQSLLPYTEGNIWRGHKSLWMLDLFSKTFLVLFVSCSLSFLEILAAVSSSEWNTLINAAAMI